MQKRLLLIGLVLSLLLTIFVPGTAAAEPETQRCTPIQFAGVAMVAVVDQGTSTQYGMTIVTRGEKIQGQFGDVEGWDSMDWATLGVNHNSIIRLTPISETQGTFSGSAWAIIIVYLSGDAGTLYGTYRATLTGDYLMTEEGIIFDNVIDSGQFAVAGRDGGSFVTASGNWEAMLFWTQVGLDVYTLAGQAQIDGEYQAIGR